MKWCPESTYNILNIMANTMAKKTSDRLNLVIKYIDLLIYYNEKLSAIDENYVNQLIHLLSQIQEELIEVSQSLLLNDQ
jgi:hypothetical protein